VAAEAFLFGRWPGNEGVAVEECGIIFRGRVASNPECEMGVRTLLFPGDFGKGAKIYIFFMFSYRLKKKVWAGGGMLPSRDRRIDSKIFLLISGMRVTRDLCIIIKSKERTRYRNNCWIRPYNLIRLYP